ncbi:MAG: 30S ribosomal protein S20 [Acidobacteriaceae bacterium]
MANHVSALKRVRQTQSKTARNRANTSRFKTALRRLREAIATGDATKAQTAFSSTASAIDKAVKKGIIHSNAGSRYKSRLSVRVKAVHSK